MERATTVLRSVIRIVLEIVFTSNCQRNAMKCELYLPKSCNGRLLTVCYKWSGSLLKTVSIQQQQLSDDNGKYYCAATGDRGAAEIDLFRMLILIFCPD